MKLKNIELNNFNEIHEFLQTHTETEVLKMATAKDLKQLYFIASGKIYDSNNTKDRIYSNLCNIIRARKTGEAFNKYYN